MNGRRKRSGERVAPPPPVAVAPKVTHAIPPLHRTITHTPSDPSLHTWAKLMKAHEVRTIPRAPWDPTRGTPPSQVTHAIHVGLGSPLIIEDLD